MLEAAAGADLSARLQGLPAFLRGAGLGAGVLRDAGFLPAGASAMRASLPAPLRCVEPYRGYGFIPRAQRSGWGAVRSRC